MNPQEYLFYIAPLAFIFLYVFAAYKTAAKGWRLLLVFRNSDKPEGDWQSMPLIVNSVMKSAVKLLLNKQGMYWRVPLFSRLFHPQLFIPWTEIREVEKVKHLHTYKIQLRIGTENKLFVKLDEADFLKIKMYI